ncbi:NAD-dependent epimerase/dehydratase family protein [Aquimarina longa]|uniref:NAD-dependent epimerase/dehydratase family protein n=1 Tax=Aquimarina longa TaxID=1080221 RepID=UPI00078336B0|nr:NAD-dependent epimerase/dehydratase family protein [Aquimarina longa]
MILVTGATGLVGGHLLVKLVKENYSIRALYRTETKKEQTRKVFLYYFPNEEGEELFNTIDWVNCTINDIPALTEVFEGITHVYHCAAKISFNPSDYKELRKTNIEGTANIVNLCLLNNIEKFCYVSSIATLGESSFNSPVDESTEWNPETPNSVYAITKYGAEIEVWRGIHEGLNAVIVNPGIIIGPGYFDSGSGYLFKRIHEGMNYFTTGITGYVAIKDVITIMHQLMNGPYNNQRYILIGENISYKNVFCKIATALNKPIPKKKVSPLLMKVAYYIQHIGHTFFRTKQSIFKSSIRGAFLITYYDNNKIKKELTYSFIPIEKSIKETAHYFLAKSQK